MKKLTYDEMMIHYEHCLNRDEDTVTVLGRDFLAGSSLRELDPIAFREDFNNWLDSEIQSGNISDVSNQSLELYIINN